MTRLFIRFYVGVLIVLFLAWYIHGSVSKRRSDADIARVSTFAHAGGARIVAEELSAAGSEEQREVVLQKINKQFDYPVRLMSHEELGESARKRIQSGADVVYDGRSVVTMLDPDSELVRLGRFPDYERAEIEASMAGWMRLARDRIKSVPFSQRESQVAKLQGQFDMPVALMPLTEVPEMADRIKTSMNRVSLFSWDYVDWYTGIQLDEETAIRFGPFPKFEDVEQKAATTTLALVLLPAAIAIALLLRPVANQLRHLENASKRIAGGDLSARVDERRMHSAKPLASTFNHMANRTESLVRTQRELLQAVSHELRTPLARMRFAIDLIGSSRSDAERQEKLASLEAATDELDGLVGELLSYVRLETTNPNLRAETIFLRETMECLTPRYASLFPNVDFDFDGGNVSVWADGRAFQRAIGNLISNAAKHAKSSVKVTAELRGNQAHICVDDDGVGIPEVERQRVFEPFVRLDRGETKGGVGLGLALVQRIMVQSGGTVEVSQSPMGGCRIETTWPTSSVEQSDAQLSGLEEADAVHRGVEAKA